MLPDGVAELEPVGAELLVVDGDKIDVKSILLKLLYVALPNELLYKVVGSNWKPCLLLKSLKINLIHRINVIHLRNMN